MCDLKCFVDIVLIIDIFIDTVIIIGLRGRPELSSFSRAYTAYAGGRGSMAVVRLLNVLFMGQCDFEKRPQNQHFQSTVLIGSEGVTQEHSVTLLIMLTILNDRFCSSSSDGNTSVED